MNKNAFLLDEFELSDIENDYIENNYNSFDDYYLNQNETVYYGVFEDICLYLLYEE